MTQSATQPSQSSLALMVPLEFRFTGGALGYLVVQGLTVAITVLSLGLLFPWAFVMRCRWRARHSTVNGSQVEFTGTTADLVGHCVLWCLFTVATFGLYAFCIPGRLAQWVVKHHRVVLPVPAAPVTAR